MKDGSSGPDRRRILIGGGACALTLALTAPGFAQESYPSRRITLLIGFPAGSGADIGGRFVASELQKACGQTVVVDNRPGAGSNIAVGLASKAKPDGYTLLIAASSAMAGSRYLYKDFSIDTENDFDPIALLWEATFLVAVGPDSQIATLADLTQSLKSKPRTLYGFTNQTGQLTAAYYLSQVGASAEPVSYRAATEAVADLARGALDFMVLDGAFASGMLRNQKIKALALTTAKRVDTFAGVPTMAEAGVKDFVFAPFWALYAPRGTPPEIRTKVEGWLQQIFASDAARHHYATTGGNIDFGGGAVLRERLSAEIKKWAQAVKAAGVEPL